MVALTGVTSTLYSAAPSPNSGSRRAVFLSCCEGPAARGRLLALRFSADDAATDDDADRGADGDAADCCDAEGDADAEPVVGRGDALAVQPPALTPRRARGVGASASAIASSTAASASTSISTSDSTATTTSATTSTAPGLYGLLLRSVGKLSR